MTKTTTTMMILAVTAALSLASSAAVEAQPAAGPGTYVSVSVGAQPLRTTVDAEATSTIFDETAVFSAAHRISNGPFFDISASHHIKWTDLLIGGGFTYFSSKGSASGTASIPDPLFVGQPSTVPISGDDLERSERTFNIQAIWLRPINKKIDLGIAFGPSIINVSQEFLSGSVADGTQTVTFGPDKQSGTGFGLNIGGDVSYMFNPRYGAGLLVRYTWAKVGLDAADVTVGGLQIGVGLRARF